MIRFLSSAFLVISILIQTDCADKYADEKRPYEFGFKIDGQQDRHEKRDKNGIIMGEFGFITADDVYHVTVYATDEQGRFKILSMKNIHLKDTKSVTSVRQGHSLKIPSTHKAAVGQVTTTTNQPITQEFQPVSLEPPANSCSHCSLPTTSTAAPKPIPSISSRNANNGYNALSKTIDSNVAQISPVEYNGLSPNIVTQQNTVSSLQSTIKSNQQNYAKGLGIQQNSVTNVDEQQDLESAKKPPTQKANIQYQNYPNAAQTYPSVSGTQQNYHNSGQNYPPVSGTEQNKPTTGQNYPSVYETQQNYPTAGQNNPSAPGTQQNYPTAGQNYPTVSRIQQNNPSQGIKGEQDYARIPTLEAPGKQTDSQQTYPQNLQEGTKSILQPTVEQRNGFNPTPSFAPEFDTSNARSVGRNGKNNKFSGNTYNSQVIQPGVEQTPKEILSTVNIPGNRTPKRFNEDEAAPLVTGQKPTLAYAQMQVVNKNTDIHARGPGEKEGLPEGLTQNDMVRLLYTFNYTLGFQGHFEEGYSNGVKQGYYFVTGRNGVRTRIDYTADDTGFHPKISQEVLDLLSDDVPRPETEKQAKYGLKGYEFKWLYYPVDSKRQ